MITTVKVTEKLSIEIKIAPRWGMKDTTIPVVIGVLKGLIKKELEK